MKHNVFLIPAFVTLALACSSDGPAEPEIADYTYSMQVTGAVTASPTGPAAFGTSEESGQETFAIILGSDTSRYVFVIAKQGTARPAAGTYAIGAPGGSGWGAAMIMAEGEELLGMYFSETGRIVITESMPTRIRGRVEISASGLAGDEPGAITEVEFEGAFDARPFPTGTAVRALRMN
jgi:hypothetical protein